MWDWDTPVLLFFKMNDEPSEDSDDHCTLWLTNMEVDGMVMQVMHGHLEDDFPLQTVVFHGFSTSM